MLLEVFAPPLSLQPTNGGDIAQLVEQRTENPCVVGSIPTITTTSYYRSPLAAVFFCPNFGLFNQKEQKMLINLDHGRLPIFQLHSGSRRRATV